jgi:pimeloyl-ACP methyl ester carboxylesterase
VDPKELADLNYDNRSLAIGSNSLTYRVEGDGELKIILLHGLNSHSGTWRKCLPKLALRAKVVAPSLPPHKGKASSELAGRYAELVSALCEKAGIESAVVIGNSMGGWVAMRLASVDRNLVSRIVLEDSAGVESEDVAAVEKAGIPILIVWGESDAVLTLGTGKKLHSRLSKSGMSVLPGAGHVPHWERPDEFVRVIEDFVRG